MLRHNMHMSDNNQNNQGGSLGLIACVTMISGGMIGSAIFSLSGLTVYLAGPSAIFSWIIAAAIMLIYGLVVAELSTIFPKSGGVFVFPSKALGKTEKTGKFWGWISTWGYINANIVAIAFAAIYVGTYLGVGFPILANLQIPLALGAIAFCFILNTLKFAVAGRLNNILVGILILTMLIFICVGIFGGSWDSSQLVPFFSQGASGSTGFLSVVPTAMVGYGSIVAIAFMVSEVKDPNKNVPKSILIAMGIVVTLYSLIILATVGLITAGYLAENPGMRFIPLYAASFTKLTAYPWIAKVISISAVLALLTTMLVVIALTSRAIAATAEGGLLPEALRRNGKTGTPIYATILVAALGAIVSCFPEFTAEIVSLGALFAAITISINCVSLIVARKKNAYVPGNFRAPGGNVLPVVVLIILIICYIPDIIGGGWVLWLYTIAWYLLGFIIYSYYSRKNKKAE
ncbi:amino acid/polyamine/organocation transporter (APC superfamily) [Kineothrix alysoides]|uniref:Amino acid/polyamine/organocation transporter (APC superfamily) n=2 Tax=Kineothrix alysoides TaxID=1469948 RepID=A0A4R1QN84_9FIRM|nr:amino acid/polyamine/organocation transporter (APC superfamily) [Kineothrix alysoides]